MIGFAHRGAPATHQRENTLAAFRRARAAGANGLESDVWITADGVAVLHHDPAVGVPGRRRRLSETRAADLPDWLPSLERLYGELGTSFQLSLDLKGQPGDSTEAAATVLDVARTAGGTGAVRRLWLCGSVSQLAAWRRLDADVRLVNSTDVRAIAADGGIDAYAAVLCGLGVDALNLRAREWTPPRAAIAVALHAYRVAAFGWDAQSTRTLTRLAGYGLDALYSDHLGRLVRTTGHRSAGGS